VAVSTPRERRSWYVYDWANSAFQTTVVTVFLGPYLTGVAEAAAGADGFLRPLGVPIRASAYCSIVVSNAWLPDLAGPDERDAVSSRGWALGYAGGGLLLPANLALFTLAEAAAG
jgi:MFS-type transporter involved in bile tolerance (Atg22 family)